MEFGTVIVMEDNKNMLINEENNMNMLHSLGKMSENLSENGDKEAKTASVIDSVVERVLQSNSTDSEELMLAFLIDRYYSKDLDIEKSEALSKLLKKGNEEGDILFKKLKMRVNGMETEALAYQASSKMGTELRKFDYFVFKKTGNEFLDTALGVACKLSAYTLNNPRKDGQHGLKLGSGVHKPEYSAFNSPYDGSGIWMSNSGVKYDESKIRPL